MHSDRCEICHARLSTTGCCYGCNDITNQNSVEFWICRRCCIVDFSMYNKFCGSYNWICKGCLKELE